MVNTPFANEFLFPAPFIAFPLRCPGHSHGEYSSASEMCPVSASREGPTEGQPLRYSANLNAFCLDNDNDDNHTASRREIPMLAHWEIPSPDFGEVLVSVSQEIPLRDRP